MKWPRVGVTASPPGWWVGWGMIGRVAHRVRGHGRGLGLGLLAALLTEGRCVAQAHLRLPDPHTMVRATRTVQAGLFPLDSLTGLPELRFGAVYVPEQCVGTRPCPLFIGLNGGFGLMMEYMRPALDTFGIIFLGTEGGANASSDTIIAYFDRGERHFEFEYLKVELKQVFATFAIDLDKIAIMGHCATGLEATLWAAPNTALFSRVILNSTGWWAYPRIPVDSQNTTTETLVVSGFGEEPAAAGLYYTQTLRRGGHPAKHVIGFRGHGFQIEDFYGLVRWLHDSWATPTPAARPMPYVLADPLPVLTPEALRRMTAFWTRFQQEPESIKTDARRQHLREVAVPVAPEAPLSAWMVDMPALAAQYPSVAADLQQAGLTAPQHDAYRIALLAAAYVRTGLPVEEYFRANMVGEWAVILAKAMAANPVLEKNVEFLGAYPDELQALEETQMWMTP